ncbi:ImmA/IrrE family metallo-endopeptidase [Microcoleus sp. POL8_C6]
MRFGILSITTIYHYLFRTTEANWLGPALLISREAAFHIAKTEMSVVEASRFYRVSEQVITMRLNMSGARKILNFSKKKRNKLK